MIGYYFGWPDGQVWPNLLASALCAAVVWWRVHRAVVVRHVRQAAQAAMHHAERLDQAERHHAEVKRLLASHCADLKTHVTEAASVPQVAAQVAEDIKREVRQRRGGERM